MKNDKIADAMEELLKASRPLSDIDTKGLEESNSALSQDPAHIAGVIKSLFVNDILIAMKEQRVNKSVLAARLGKSRQYVNNVLDDRNPGNFTIDTMVSFSAALGLRPKRFSLEPMKPVELGMVITRRKQIKIHEGLQGEWCNEPECECSHYEPMSIEEAVTLVA
jgi:hypothetical protein